MVQATLNLILQSPLYANNTLVLVTYDEGGGYFDHVSPPARVHPDGERYGTRVPLIAAGYFAKENYGVLLCCAHTLACNSYPHVLVGWIQLVGCAVSHVETEHSSLVRFLEWAFFNSTGQLGRRDAYVQDIFDMLNQTRTGPLPPY
jgi:phospholipase C